MKKFIVDEMLFDVAKYLRFMGYDVLVMKSGTRDSDLVEVATKEKRILVTADRALHTQALKEGAEAIFLDIRAPFEEKLRSIICNLELVMNEQTRCTKCGGSLEQLPREKADVPEEIKERYSSFERCLSCGHIFWRGSHWKAMKKRIEKIISSC